MIQWLKDNYIFILAGLTLLSVILNIIILLLKRVPISRIVKVISMIPSLVSQAEKTYFLTQSGSDKKDMVRELFFALLDDFGISKYSKFIDIDNIIEEVLSTPQKKGE